MGSPKQQAHWADHARQWRHIGPPLRPCAEDLRHLTDRAFPRASEGRKESGPLRVLLLGVTPEIASLTWPAPVELSAVDRSQAMIDLVWPGDGPGRRALLGDWLELPAFPESFDLAIGDGCFSMFDVPEGYRRLSKSIAGALRPGGALSIRLYARPDETEPVDRVFDDLWNRRIGNFHVFKWRLAMALQGDSPAECVRLSSIWETYAARVPDPAALAERTGWPLAEVLTMNAYRGATSSYSYPKASRVIALLDPEFELVETCYGAYELGERCPQLLLLRR